MKSKFVLSMFGLLLIAASLSAFTSIPFEEKKPVKTETVSEDNQSVQTYAVRYEEA
jgi:hypothetical protein